MKDEPHKHKMSNVITEKILLYNWQVIRGEWNNVLSGSDLMTLKQCVCGFKEPINVERTRLYDNSILGS
jgi:hypothetical protein